MIPSPPSGRLVTQQLLRSLAQRHRRLPQRSHAVLVPTRGRCVSIFLDKNRRYIGKSQSKRPPERTQRTPHRCCCCCRLLIASERARSS
jgi:hypothetical protein